MEEQRKERTIDSSLLGGQKRGGGIYSTVFFVPSSK